MRIHESVEIYSFHRRSEGRRGAPFLLLLILAVARLSAVSPALAQTTGASSAFGESVTVSVAPLLGSPLKVTSGPLPVVSGSGAASYNFSNQVASASASALMLGQVLGTGVITVHAGSSLPGTSLVTADSTVNNLGLNLVGVLPLLTAQANTVQSSAQVGGSCAGAPIASGSANLTGLRLGGTLGLGLTIPANPLPNTVLLDLVGIRVVLNEQIATQSGNTRTMTVNALHVSINGLASTGLGLLTADVVVAQAKASMTCPAPSGADLAVSIVDDSTGIKAGTLLTYTLEVTNNGPLTAVGATLVNTLPAGVELFAVDSTLGLCTPGPVIVCDLGNLAPGDHATITVVVETILPGNLVATAAVASATSDPNLANNQASEITEVDPANPE